MEASRRDFLEYSMGALGIMATVGIAYPILKSLGPNAATSLQSKVSYDISAFKPLELRVTSWKGFPTFVMKLPNPFSWDGPQRDNKYKNHNKDIIGNHSVYALIGVCTHLGCIPLWKPYGDTSINPSNIPVFHCPCHGSIYTPWGDNISGPAPLPLGVPPQNLNGSILEIGTPGFVKKFWDPYV